MTAAVAQSAAFQTAVKAGIASIYSVSESLVKLGPVSFAAAVEIEYSIKQPTQTAVTTHQNFGRFHRNAAVVRLLLCQAPDQWRKRKC